MAANIPQFKKDYVLQLHALGVAPTDIGERFRERYGHTLSRRTIWRLKKDNKEDLKDAQNSIIGNPNIVSSPLLKQKTYRRLNRRLDRTEKDETEIERLRRQWQAGEIDQAKFEREVIKWEFMATNEIIKIADMSHTHSRHGDDETPMTAADQAALSLLSEGLKSGNPFQLIQVLNPKVSPNEENPAPPVDTP